MYPNNYLSLFPPFPRDNRVFVAMSFDSQFDARWKNVIVPAIKSVNNGKGTYLIPHRVDLRKASDSVLTEILEGISRCRFFLADITTIGEIDGRPIRNGNVLYEVGLAHAIRLPEEVALLRSDNKELLFDVMNIRVLEYDPDSDPKAAQKIVIQAIAQSLNELDLRKSLTVRHVAESLDLHSWDLIFEAVSKGIVHQPPARNMGEVLGGANRRHAIDRLLETGALRAEIKKLTPGLIKNVKEEEVIVYTVTELGRAVAEYGFQALGLKPGMAQQILKEHLDKDKAQD